MILIRHLICMFCSFNLRWYAINASNTSQPSSQPTLFPGCEPSLQPIRNPTTQPSQQPVRTPTKQPITFPSEQPSQQPLEKPTMQPTKVPVKRPSQQPRSNPTVQPSMKPKRLNDYIVILLQNNLYFSFLFRISFIFFISGRLHGNQQKLLPFNRLPGLHGNRQVVHQIHQ